MDSTPKSNSEQKTREESTIRSQSTSRIDDLPREVAIDVLSRLPITSLLQYKSTSHMGLNLTSDPKFLVMFQNHESNRNPSVLLLCNSDESSQLYFVDVDHDERHNITARKLNTPFLNFDVVGSYNGLLCISHMEVIDSTEITTLHVYNPLLGEVMPLPKPNQYTNQTEVYGFGFDLKTKMYKAVRIVHHVKVERVPINRGRALLGATYMSEIEVLTLGTDQAWRNKGQPQQRFELPDLSLACSQTIVAGSVHWLGCLFTRSRPRSIIAFDLETETLQEIPNPEFDRHGAVDSGVCEISECLSLATFYENGQIEIWVMKEYKVKDSWIKKFSMGSFNGDLGSNSTTRFERVICGFKNDQVLMKYENASLVLYDSVADTFQVLRINGLQNEFHAFCFMPSLLTIKAALEKCG